MGEVSYLLGSWAQVVRAMQALQAEEERRL